MNLLPGTKEAKERGCCCPELPPIHGLDDTYREEISYWIDRDCPLHGQMKNGDTV